MKIDGVPICQQAGKSSKTTEIYPAQWNCARVYTHVSKRDLGKIVSPLDKIEEGSGIGKS
ncbi:hypothetical protein KAX02_13315 [candidate division WOR-3 bacterium]|nr:hypothetical protein [candidate division WOR-3 bacterium]